MAKIVDPDSLNQATEVVIDTAGKTIKLLVAGNLNDTAPGSTSGVTLQAVYSFLKEEWKTDAALNKFKFPIKMFTKTDGQFQNGWNWIGTDSGQTRQLVRDAGWTEITGDKYAGLITLGNFDATGDQGYYLQTTGFTGTTANFDKTGNVNEAVMIYNATGPVDSTGYLKAFLRIQAKLYGEYNLLSEQGISALEPVLYRLPLSNSTDLKVTAADATIDANTPYTGMKIDYLKGSGFTTWANSTVYAAGAVVQELTGSPKRWFFTAAGGTSSGTDVQDDTGVTDWVAYYGEESINGVYYAFNRIVTGNNGTDREIYDWAMRQLRKTTDINAETVGIPASQRGFGVVKGNIAVPLVEYVGDTLKPKPGVLLRGFSSASTNNIIHRDITVGGGGLNSEFVPITSTERAFPTVASGTLEFSANLVSEADADTKYTMYFTTNPGGNFDTSSAIIVDNNSAADITGQITAASIAWDFDYTNNAQGGRTPNTNADVTVVAQGLPGAEWTIATATITATSGQTITVTANDERNYSNPT